MIINIQYEILDIFIVYPLQRQDKGDTIKFLSLRDKIFIMSPNSPTTYEGGSDVILDTSQQVRGGI